MSVQTLSALGLGALSLLSACIPEYHRPTSADPHATIKLRRTYDSQAGVSLHEALLVDEHVAFQAEVPAGLSREPRIDVSLVHPVPATFAVSSSFYHRELRQVEETYYEQEPHLEYESYDCSSGFGTSAVHRSCTRNVTRYVQVPHRRWVPKWVDVVDAECQALARFRPAKDRVYLLQYNFQEHRACSLSCFEQSSNSDGTFTNASCPSAPPSE